MKDIYIMEDYATSEEVPMNYKLTEGCDSQLHGHSFVEIFYVISGSAPHRFDNEPTKTLQAGDTYLIMPSHIHEFLRRKQDCMCRRAFWEKAGKIKRLQRLRQKKLKYPLYKMYTLYLMMQFLQMEKEPFRFLN